jgi:hypothetical protein
VAELGIGLLGVHLVEGMCEQLEKFRRAIRVRSAFEILAAPFTRRELHDGIASRAVKAHVRRRWRRKALERRRDTMACIGERFERQCSSLRRRERRWFRGRISHPRSRVRVAQLRFRLRGAI